MMETDLLTSPVRDDPVELLPGEQPIPPEADPRAEVCQEIARDCRMDPEEYLEEIQVAASGE
jgi:hypothetical protein